MSALYPDRPKALVPIAGRPFLERQLEWLAAGGISRVHIAAGYMADSLLDWLRGRGEPLEKSVQCSVFGVQRLSTIHQSPFTVSLSREPVPLGTGGGLKFAEPWIESDPFLVLNGDSLLPNLDFPMIGKKSADFSNDWKKQGEKFPMIGKNSEKVSNDWKIPEAVFPMIGKLPPCLIMVTQIEEAGRYGTVEFDGQRRVTAFREKEKRQGGWVNSGVYLLPRILLAALDPEVPLSLETDVFPELARQGRLLAFPAPPPLLDMGTPEGLEAMEDFFKTGG
ncbi:MAG: NTP transferase domain-containing protein [Verrucomicrobia bacterium]|nr:NTP transferase domain-containing protein [Verrucomicrobiota bacterium]